LYCKHKGFVQPDERFAPSKIISAKLLDDTIEDFRTFILNCPSRVVEYTVHPGLLSNDPMDRPEYRIHRTKEYKLLTNPKCFNIINASGFNS
jgi:predicted glycoside hydrolase/deacetylase ChbG (UPF0249 family)